MHSKPLALFNNKGGIRTRVMSHPTDVSVPDGRHTLRKFLMYRSGSSAARICHQGFFSILRRPCLDNETSERRFIYIDSLPQKVYGPADAGPFHLISIHMFSIHWELYGFALCHSMLQSTRNFTTGFCSVLM